MGRHAIANAWKVGAWAPNAWAGTAWASSVIAPVVEEDAGLGALPYAAEEPQPWVKIRTVADMLEVFPVEHQGEKGAQEQEKPRVYKRIERVPLRETLEKAEQTLEILRKLSYPQEEKQVKPGQIAPGGPKPAETPAVVRQAEKILQEAAKKQRAIPNEVIAMVLGDEEDEAVMYAILEMLDL